MANNTRQQAIKVATMVMVLTIKVTHLIKAALIWVASQQMTAANLKLPQTSHSPLSSKVLLKWRRRKNRRTRKWSPSISLRSVMSATNLI
jgi:hypothetical protein